MQPNKQSILSSLLILASAISITLLSSSAAASTQTALSENAPKWTGFYAGAGAGMGAWTGDSKITANGSAVTATQKQGGDGGFVMLTTGYDYLFKYSIVAGAFIDGDLGRLTGSSAFSGAVGNQSETGSLGLGVRFGKLISPTILPYLTAGVSRAYFDHVNFNVAIAGGGFSGVSTPSFTLDGLFLGAGLEVKVYSNWFLRGEYRYANYHRQSIDLNGPPISAGNFKLPFNPIVQTFQAVMVYKF